MSDFTSAEVVVLRSNWDFHDDLDAFTEWLSSVERSSATLHNPAPLVRDYLDKRYLSMLSEAGVPVPISFVAPDLTASGVATWIDEHNLSEVVLKPAWGASGHDVELVPRSELDAAATAWSERTDRRPMVVQQFVPGVRDGEHALVYLGGHFSHALIRRPASGDFRVNSQHGGTMAPNEHVDRAMIEFGDQILSRFLQDAIYARIDVVRSGDEFVLMEVEVNEPALGLDVAPGSAARFASAIDGA